ncbi:MoaF C-terminal domain-containing protein [Microterricola viridarii]|uniref:Molybdenum cofactor biosynthesis protein MoaF n=1 Tax=Microterricola viridarii TaxID=412690 RepID=A0A109QYV0_9MICO|nr:MoaF C-terminal domain-containing protein [Microterricola viridarii]AMB59340.1 molybdenum cofactor biosynthesis protein MoaF [Microterricola viridarii]
MTDTTTDPALDEWRSYDEFAAGIDTFRLPNVSLDGSSIRLTLDDGGTLALDFGTDTVRWSADGTLSATESIDPYDAVAVRENVVFVNLPLSSRERESLTIVYSTTTHRAVVTHSQIGEEEVEAAPRVSQSFWSAVTDGGTPSGEVPGPSRDLIGKRNIYRYSPEHLYEHVYVSSQRYAWQCLEGVQRGHGDMDLSTVWKFDDGLYLFCFREFRIAVASVWLHDLGYQLMTTGVFLGLNGAGESEHSRGGGHIYPLGSVAYPDAQPV